LNVVIRNAGRLVTCDPELGEGSLGVIERGALVGVEGRIGWVGRERDLEAPAGAVEVDAGGRAVLPGLVDCHTHLVFAGDRGGDFAARMRGDAYRTGGIMATVLATRGAADSELGRLAGERLDRFLSFGATTVEAKTGYGLTPGEELRLLRCTRALRHPVAVVPTLLAAHVVPAESAGDVDGYVELLCEELIPAAAGEADFCDAWCESRGAFSAAQARRVLVAGSRAGFRLKLHAEQLSHSGGAALAAELGAVSADHLEQATEEDAGALARAGTVGVLMPGASMMTGAPFAPARMLIERGVRVALSTDFNPGTSYSENLQLTVALGCGLLHMTVEEALLAVTRHAAAAVGRAHLCGRLAPGLACDVLVLESASEVDLAYHYGVNLARTVLKGGEIVHDAGQRNFSEESR
jgi:imidazolonepropionase